MDTVPERRTSPNLSDYEAWHAAGVLSALDVEFAALIARLDPAGDPVVALTAALVSRATQAGHVCLDLARRNTWRLVDTDGNDVECTFPASAAWTETLRQSALVGDGSCPSPLVIEGTRVYLHRYFTYERRLLANLRQRLSENRIALGQATLTRLSSLFESSTTGDLQRRAAYLASLHRFCVISGGPGTGKTTTVAKVLLLIAEEFRARGESLCLQLLAPTGKAAARLAESLAFSLSTLDLSDAERELLSVAPSTIHRALGYQPRCPTKFRHDARNPLPANVVIVDEAAMVDLALMTKLCEAVSPTSHLVLLGDRDQLASVEAGAVFGDLFGAGPSHGYSPVLSEKLRAALGESVSGDESAPAIADCTIHLEKSYRYAEHGGIARLARAIRSGDVKEALNALDAPDIEFIELTNEGDLVGASEQALERSVLEGFAGLRRASTPEARLEALARFRVLSPHRNGPLGVGGLNELVERVLLPSHQRRDGVYAGQPVLIHENDYQAELYNGDVGVIDYGRNGKLAAFFPETSGLRHLSLARLPAHSTVYAMTVHKSQGSEFDEVVVVLPHHSSPLLSRELLYTGITRAKRRVTLAASKASLRAAIERRVERSSGLREALWGHSEKLRGQGEARLSGTR